jgi:hypothetical protein
VKSRFKVLGTLDSAGGVRAGTVTIDRASGLLHVRPLRKHREYTMPLSMVADMVVKRIIMNEFLEKQRARKSKHKRTR